jgi:hypothetical protein
MSEHPELRDDQRIRTGVDRVDAVVVDVEGLADRPVEEHVAVFERAHEQLRRALDAQPVTPPVPGHLRPS